MLTLKIQPLETSRLRLRKLTPEDAPLFYARLGGNENVAKYMLWKPHTNIEESVASIQKVLKRYETGESCRWAIALKGCDEIIGIIDLLMRDEAAGICSFAYMLAESHWNQGYGTEALEAVMAFAFTRCGIQRIEADHFAMNPASGAVMKKVGMQYRETIPGKYEKNGVLHDAVCYVLTREDWQIFSKERTPADNS